MIDNCQDIIFSLTVKNGSVVLSALETTALSHSSGPSDNK